MKFHVIKYDEKYIYDWDNFILNKSMNGTFLQTRKFINYHPINKFTDYSLIIKKGDEIVTTLLACQLDNENKKILYGHKGSTFGGISISNNVYNTSDLNEILEVLLDFLKKENFQEIFIKMVPNIYQTKDSILLDYILYLNGFLVFKELNYFLDLNKFKDNIEMSFSSSKRRDYRYSLKNNLIFKKLDKVSEISLFYEVLKINNIKLGINEIHSFDDLIKLKFELFHEEIQFYGVFFEEKLIAGTMLFIFKNKIFHTQYLASNEIYLKLFPMDYLIYNIIKIAKEKDFPLITLGISTLSLGKNLNFGLSRFKEGFGSDYFLNNSYSRSI